MSQDQKVQAQSRVRELRRLARTPYDVQLIRNAIADGLDDDQIRVMLGYTPGAADNHELPGNYDVDVTEGDDATGAADASPPVGEAGAPPQIPAKGGDDSSKSVLAHIAGLLAHLSK
jgi:hypothetical protein